MHSYMSGIEAQHMLIYSVTNRLTYPLRLHFMKFMLPAETSMDKAETTKPMYEYGEALCTTTVALLSE